MKPPPFRLAVPSTLHEVTEHLARTDSTRILAGGQSLLPMLNARRIAPRLLIDIQRVRGLDHVALDNGQIVVGAMVRQQACARHPLVVQYNPLLSDAIGYIGSAAIRNRGTVVGSLCHGAASAELPLLLTLLDGSVLARSQNQVRLIPASGLFVGDIKTCLKEDEIVTEARFPVLPTHSVYAFNEYARRRGDPAVCSVAALVTHDGYGTPTHIRIAASGVTPTPFRCHETERWLRADRWKESGIIHASKLAAQSATTGDIPSAERPYRRHLLMVMIHRTLTDVQARLRASGHAQQP